MTEPKTLLLLDRLRGVYHLPVNDGCGPIDGSMVFTRSFKPLTPLHGKAADMISRLEAGEVLEWGEVNELCMELIQPMDPLETGKTYVIPILAEAATRIYHLQYDADPPKAL
jgi:hypothetical protein